MKKVLSLVIILAVLVSVAIPVGAVAKVTGVKQTGCGTTWVDIEWSRYTNADRYKVEYSDTLNGSYKKITDYNTSGYCSFSNLFKGSTYYVKVTPYVNNNWLTSATSTPISVATKPDSVTNLKQTAATANSITLKWTAADGATSYNIYKYYSYTNVKKIGTSKTNSYTLKGLSNKSAFDFDYIYVAPVRSSATYNAEGSSTSISSYSLRLIPKKGDTPKISSYWSYSGNVYFTYPSLKHQDGYQFKIYKANKKKAVKTLTNSTSCQLKKGQAYKVRTRSYALVNSTKKYGAWSSYKYFVPGVKSLRVTSRTQHSVKIKWAKVKGGKVKYDIYVSTSYNKGKKKALKNVKGTSARITKCGKKSLKRNSYYYFYVVPKVKAGKKYKASPIYSYVTTYTRY